MNTLDELVKPKVNPQAFEWPMPPGPIFPENSDQVDDDPCEFVGLNGQRLWNVDLHSIFDPSV